MSLLTLKAYRKPLLNLPLLSHCQFFFHPFLLIKKFLNFFYPSLTFLTIPGLLQAQKENPVLSTVYTWSEQIHRLYTLTPIIMANSFLFPYNKQFQRFYFDPKSHLIQ